MLIEFTVKASELHRVCARVAARLSARPDEESTIQFKVTPEGVGIYGEGVHAHLMADVQTSGTASVPFAVVAGVLHILPYFGNEMVEIGFSTGRMRVDSTVFHNRHILLSSTSSFERPRTSSKSRALQLA